MGPRSIGLPAHWDPSATVIGMAGAVSALTLWGWCLRNSWRRRRRWSCSGIRLIGALANSAPALAASATRSASRGRTP